MKPLLLFFLSFFRGADLNFTFILRAAKCIAAETFAPELIFFLFKA